MMQNVWREPSKEILAAANVQVAWVKLRKPSGKPDFASTAHRNWWGREGKALPKSRKRREGILLAAS
eukprot:9059208-Pyramimonas_sp.AAC.1